MDTTSPRLRMSILGVVVIACFVALFARLWYLQVMEAPALAAMAKTLCGGLAVSNAIALLIFCGAAGKSGQ